MINYLQRNTILRKLSVVFLLILLPLLAIGIGVYNWGMNMIRNEIIIFYGSKILASPKTSQ